MRKDKEMLVRTLSCGFNDLLCRLLKLFDVLNIAEFGYDADS